MIDNGSMADHYAQYPRSSPQRAQTMSSVSRRDASREVQRPLRNEQGDNLEQLKKIRFHLFFSFSARSKAGGRCRSAVLNLSECLCLFRFFNLAFKRQSISVMNCSRIIACTPPPPPPPPSFLLGFVEDHAMTFDNFLEICSYLQAPQRDRATVALPFFFFTVDRTTNRVQAPSLPYESSFVCPRRANLKTSFVMAVHHEH